MALTMAKVPYNGKILGDISHYYREFLQNPYPTFVHSSSDFTKFYLYEGHALLSPPSKDKNKNLTLIPICDVDRELSFKMLF